MSNLSETLLSAMDVVTKERTQKLPYDKTLKCKIIDVSEAEHGIYYVENQGTIMTAFSENKEYNEDEAVYVTIPCGDFSGDKIITGRVITIPDDLVSYRPFDLYAPVTSNFNTKYGQGDLDEFTLIPNKSTQLKQEIFSQVFFADDMKTYAGYEALGIKLAIAARMPKNTLTGKYQITINISYIDQTKVSTINFNNITAADVKTDTYKIDFDDMIAINYYNTAGFNLQEKVFNIRNKLIKSINIYIEQTEEFLNEDDIRFFSESYYVKTRDLQCTFGYQVDPALLTGQAKIYAYTYDGYNYEDKSNIKNILSRVVRFEKIANEGIKGIIQENNNFIFQRWIENIVTDEGTVEKELVDTKGLIGRVTLNPIISNVETNYVIQGIFLGSNIESNKLVFTNLAHVSMSEMVILLSQQIKDLQNRITALESR